MAAGAADPRDQGHDEHDNCETCPERGDCAIHAKRDEAQAIIKDLMHGYAAISNGVSAALVAYAVNQFEQMVWSYSTLPTEVRLEGVQLAIKGLQELETKIAAEASAATGSNSLQ